jgi:hypothetical protein
MTRATPLPDTVTLQIPFRVPKRGGRKEMQLPSGLPPQRKTANTLIKALARASRWKRMLESGEFATIGDLAEREKVAGSYLIRILQLSLLAPDLVEAILLGYHDADVTLEALRQPVPLDWEEQRGKLALR